VPQVRALLRVVLPRRRLDAAIVIALVQRTQPQNYAAYCSHRRRTIRRLDTS
jgi:hypothetical protein